MYSHRIESIEKSWRSTQFKILPGLDQDVPLLTVKRSLWALLLNFARAHDAYDTKGQWSVFDSCNSWLKIYTRESTERHEPGFHAFIKPTYAKNWSFNYEKNDDEVLLVWQPPCDWNLGHYKNEIGPRYYWDAETTHDWLVNELIPYALFWNSQKVKDDVSIFAKMWSKGESYQSFAKNLKLENLVWSHKSGDINDTSKVVDVKTLENMASYLQQSYNGNHSNSMFLPAGDYCRLYKALHKVLCCTHLDEGVVRYVLEKLSHLGAKDFGGLVSIVREHANDSFQICDNSFQIDLILRCLDVCLRDCRSSLNNVEVQEVAELLAPVLHNVLRMELLDRQKKRLLPQY